MSDAAAHTATVSLTVSVTDINDVTPSCSPAVYYVTVAENTAAGKRALILVFLLSAFVPYSILRRRTTGDITPLIASHPRAEGGEREESTQTDKRYIVTTFISLCFVFVLFLVVVVFLFLFLFFLSIRSAVQGWEL